MAGTDSRQDCETDDRGTRTTNDACSDCDATPTTGIPKALPRVQTAQDPTRDPGGLTGQIP
jgi:hypothetical protein